MKNILLFVFITFFSILHAQVIKGFVVDDLRVNIVGAKLTNLSTKEVVLSDFDGSFAIKGVVGDKLSVTMVNFQTKIVTIQGNNLKIQLSPELNNLNEVVVVGYGSKKAGSITGSVVQIKANDIVKTPAQSAIQAIQGKAAGVNIVTNDEPGANPSVRIRGLGTILGGRDPLYIIDGLESNSLNGLSPNDIETIDILKDASSLAIYGQKGSNGVIIISTKKGKKGEIKVNYSSFIGQKFIQREVKMADSFLFTYYNNAAAGSATYFNQNQPYNTNWLNEIKTIGETSNNTVSVSGASENANYFFGATNYKEKGILRGTSFERTNINSRNQFSAFNSKLKITQNVNLSISNNTSKPASAFTSAYKQSPLVPVYFPNGRYGLPLRDPDTGLVDILGSDLFNNVSNPVAELNLTNNKNRTINLFGNVGAELKLHKNWIINSNFGMNYYSNKGFNYISNRDTWLYRNASASLEDYYATFGNKVPIINTLELNTNEGFSWNLDNFVTFKKKFNKNDFKIVAGTSRTTKDESNFLNGIRTNVPEQQNYWNLDLSSNATLINPSESVRNNQSTPVVSMAIFARLEYEYNDKYLATVVVRREGVSNFAKDKRWANFPSISAGWIISKEDFLADSKSINFLKLRAGYGEVGNSNIGNGLNSITFNGANYSFGNPSSINPGLYIPRSLDPNLTWETMKEIDFAIDFKIFNNLSGTIEYYNRNSSNLILPVQIPSVLSIDPVFLNTGTVNNTGYEFSLNYSKKFNSNWSVVLSGNFSYNKNTLKQVDNSYFANYIGGGLGNGQFTKQVVVGQPLGSFNVFSTNGFDSDGNFVYSDQRAVAGTYLPSITYGNELVINYKKFDFTISTYGVAGNKIYNGKKAQRFGGENVEDSLLTNFWTPSTPNAKNPKPSNEIPRASTYYLEDGSFLRINNITLGYTLPKFVKAIDSVRLYFTALNPFLFTKYSGFSPEIVGDNNANPLGSAGIELNAYPTNKTFLFGINLNL